MGIHYFFDNSQPQSVPSRFTTPAGIQACKGFKNSLPVCGRNAQTIIIHMNQKFRTILFKGDLDKTISIAGGILYQVADRPSQLAGLEARLKMMIDQIFVLEVC